MSTSAHGEEGTVFWTEEALVDSGFRVKGAGFRFQVTYSSLCGILGGAGNDSGGECGVAVAKRFRMPDSATRISDVPSNAPFWYSFAYGSVHFTIISTEHDLHRGSPQREVGAPPSTLTYHRLGPLGFCLLARQKGLDPLAMSDFPCL